MKNILLILLAAFVFIGCTQKLETSVHPYLTLNQNETQDIKVNFLGVNDQRDTKIVSRTLDGFKVENEYPLNIDVKKWYTQALIKEFKNADMITANEKPDIKLLVNIKKISAVYTNDNFDTKNLKANIRLELVIKIGDEIITSNIQNKQTLYKTIVFDAESFEPIVNEIMKDSVSKTVAIAIEKLKGQ